MIAQLLLPTFTIEELVDRILLARRVTLTDRHQLRLAILEAALSEAEHVLIDRVLYGVRKGLLYLEN